VLKRNSHQRKSPKRNSTFSDSYARKPGASTLLLGLALTSGCLMVAQKIKEKDKMPRIGKIRHCGFMPQNKRTCGSKHLRV
jgi:hypothetical protein